MKGTSIPEDPNLFKDPNDLAWHVGQFLFNRTLKSGEHYKPSTLTLLTILKALLRSITDEEKRKIAMKISRKEENSNENFKKTFQLF